MKAAYKCLSRDEVTFEELTSTNSKLTSSTDFWQASQTLYQNFVSIGSQCHKWLLKFHTDHTPGAKCKSTCSSTAAPPPSPPSNPLSTSSSTITTNTAHLSPNPFTSVTRAVPHQLQVPWAAFKTRWLLGTASRTGTVYEKMSISQKLSKKISQKMCKLTKAFTPISRNSSSSPMASSKWA